MLIKKNPNLENLLEDDFFFHKVQENQQSLRKKPLLKQLALVYQYQHFLMQCAYIDGLCTKTVGGKSHTEPKEIISVLIRINALTAEGEHFIINGKNIIDMINKKQTFVCFFFV